MKRIVPTYRITSLPLREILASLQTNLEVSRGEKDLEFYVLMVFVRWLRGKLCTSALSRLVAGHMTVIGIRRGLWGHCVRQMIYICIPPIVYLYPSPHTIWAFFGILKLVFFYVCHPLFRSPPFFFSCRYRNNARLKTPHPSPQAKP